MADKNSLQQKVKLMGKLFDAGIVSEKSLQDMSTEQMIGIDAITIPEIGMILEFQKNVKSNHLYSYLAEGRRIANSMKEKQNLAEGKATEGEEGYHE